MAFSSKTVFQPETVCFVQSAYILLKVGVPYFAISSNICLTLAYGTLSASIKTASLKSLMESMFSIICDVSVKVLSFTRAAITHMRSQDCKPQKNGLSLNLTRHAVVQ